MMTSTDLIDLSAAVEPWLLGGASACVVILVADRLLTGRDLPRRPGLDAPLPLRTERLLLALVIVLGAIVRVIGWDSTWTPVFWFSEVSTLYIDRMWSQPGLWATWLQLLRSTVLIGFPHDAAMVLPVQAAVQALLGPRFGVPVLAGALFGTLAIPLAWALGRRLRSQTFGLVFAALVAFSPMMLTWSRVSALCIAAVPHVLLAMLVGWTAGRRGSVLLAIVAGVVAWTSIYEYYAARVSIPLVVAALLAGAARSWRLPRGMVLAVVVAVAFGAMAWALHGGTTLQALWPTYGGYAGNKGEKTLAEFVERNLGSIELEARHTIERCFKTRRTAWDSPATLPGVQNGGLWTIPVSALGLLGLVATCMTLRRQWLWLVLGAAGFALPVLSVMNARRALILDLAWCAFAAQGLIVAIDWIGARWSLGARRRVAALAVFAIASWAVGAVFALDAALPGGFGRHIPFGEAGFGDGITCRRCLDAAKGWGAEMADGAVVVLFDNDVFRENRTSPGGLVAYGKIAALQAGSPDRFVEGYALMAGLDPEPPTPGGMFDRMNTDFVAYLAARIERLAPSRIVWHFERPTSWERALARRLAAAGGTLERFATPLSPSPGLRVVTPGARATNALAVLRGQAAAGLARDEDSSCITLSERDGTAIGSRVLLLAPDGPGTTAPPGWLVGSYATQRYKSFGLEAPTPIGAVVSPMANGQARIELVGRNGQHSSYEVPSLRHTDLPPVQPGEHGLNCAAFAGGQWWVLDPWTGRVASEHRAALAVPRGEWIGIAGDAAGALVLASGDQSIAVFDPESATVLARFPARVGPSVRDAPDECTPLAVGDGWIATVDLRTSVMSAYDRTGRDFGTRRLDRLLHVPFPYSTVAGAGRYLGIGIGSTVRTVELHLDPDCPAKEAAALSRSAR